MGSQLAYFLKHLFNFSKPSSGCRKLEVLLQAVNCTGYRLIRRTLTVLLVNLRMQTADLPQEMATLDWGILRSHGVEIMLP